MPTKEVNLSPGKHMGITLSTCRTMKGCVVEEVFPNDQADKAGLKVGFVITGLSSNVVTGHITRVKDYETALDIIGKCKGKMIVEYITEKQALTHEQKHPLAKGLSFKKKKTPIEMINAKAQEEAAAKTESDRAASEKLKADKQAAEAAAREKEAAEAEAAANKEVEAAMAEKEAADKALQEVNTPPRQTHTSPTASNTMGTSSRSAPRRMSMSAAAMKAVPILLLLVCASACVQQIYPDEFDAATESVLDTCAPIEAALASGCADVQALLAPPAPPPPPPKTKVQKIPGKLNDLVDFLLRSKKSSAEPELGPSTSDPAITLAVVALLLFWALPAMLIYLFAPPVEVASVIDEAASAKEVKA